MKLALCGDRRLHADIGIIGQLFYKVKLLYGYLLKYVNPSSELLPYNESGLTELTCFLITSYVTKMCVTSKTSRYQGKPVLTATIVVATSSAWRM